MGASVTYNYEYFQFYSLGVAGENLTLRLRSLMFKAMLIQEIGWFDDKKNGVGSLCARLSGEPESVQGVNFKAENLMTKRMRVLGNRSKDWNFAKCGHERYNGGYFISLLRVENCACWIVLCTFTCDIFIHGGKDFS